MIDQDVFDLGLARHPFVVSPVFFPPDWQAAQAESRSRARAIIADLHANVAALPDWWGKQTVLAVLETQYTRTCGQEVPQMSQKEG